MHEQFIEPTKKHADVIIPEGANSVAVDLLKQKVHAEARGETVGPVESPPNIRVENDR
jgi:uridine kinase